jgi:hypothetical protein
VPLSEETTAREYALKRTVKRVSPEVLALEVVATWRVDGRERRYAVLRLISRETLAAGGRTVAP